MIHHRFYGTKSFLKLFLYYTKKKNKYIFEKNNTFNNLGIYAMVMYFIVHFNA